MTGGQDLSMQLSGIDLGLGEDNGYGCWERGRIGQLW